MFEKDMKIGCLLDFYGELLPERKKQIMDLYYNEDCSLSEIANEIGISRQGVRDMIVKVQQELTFFEDKLKLAKKFSDAEKQLEKLNGMLSSVPLPEDIKKELSVLSEIIKS